MFLGLWTSFEFCQCMEWGELCSGSKLNTSGNYTIQNLSFDIVSHRAVYRKVLQKNYVLAI